MTAGSGAALFEACEKGDVDEVTRLLEDGSDCGYQSSSSLVCGYNRGKRWQEEALTCMPTLGTDTTAYC